ncbi:hypothetical protein [Streptomyces sp. PR69]|nr:hypothetical protein [Streptomyces sp. PR69]
MTDASLDQLRAQRSACREKAKRQLLKALGGPTTAATGTGNPSWTV